MQARRELLVAEKEFLRARELLAVKRRELPWERVTDDYRFVDRNGKRSLRDLFGRKSQLIVYHFMFAPEWDAGCPHCSFWADHFDGTLAHLAARDVAFAVISRAPIDKISSYQDRMGWHFPWLSSNASTFNFDFGASFTPQARADGTAIYNYANGDPGGEDREGISVFARSDDSIFHTYSTYARGIDMVNGTYQFLDLVPKGRHESPDEPQAWVRRHDEYDD
jgi:predicted dithiol-disulfide oxidoreductase (DUF899 family)